METAGGRFPAVSRESFEWTVFDIARERKAVYSLQKNILAEGNMESQTKGEPMELISYGIFKQDFYAIVKQYGKYILHRMMPVPECSYFNELGIEEHIREFEDDECSDQYVFTKQEDCFRKLLSGAGDKRKGRECMAAGNPAFTDEGLLLLSRGILSLINGAQEALKLVDYDHAVHFAVLKALDKYRDLNAKVCGMVSQSCE